MFLCSFFRYLAKRLNRANQNLLAKKRWRSEGDVVEHGLMDKGNIVSENLNQRILIGNLQPLLSSSNKTISKAHYDSIPIINICYMF